MTPSPTPNRRAETWRLWLCSACRQWAEQEPGDTCEVCEEGTIESVEVVPLSSDGHVVVVLEREGAMALNNVLNRPPHPEVAAPLGRAHKKLSTALKTLHPLQTEEEG